MSVIKNTKLYILISALIIIAGIVVTLLCNGFNLGIEFTGGRIIAFDTAVEFNPKDITDALNKSGIKGVPLQIAFNDQTIKSVAILKAKTQNVTDEKINAAYEIIKSKYTQTEIKYNEVIGQTARLRWFLTPAVAIIVSVAIVFVFALVYFKQKIALTILICLVHDIILLLAVAAITRHEITSDFAIVIMAVAAFSIYLNFALFAKVKEHLKHRPNTSDKNVIEKSLPETINYLKYPAASLILVALVLALLAQPMISGLALVFAAGIAISVYSNIVFAGPVYIKLTGTNKQKPKEALS